MEGAYISSELEKPIQIGEIFLNKLPSILGGSPALDRRRIENGQDRLGQERLRGSINLETGKFAMGKETENLRKILRTIVEPSFQF